MKNHTFVPLPPFDTKRALCFMEGRLYGWAALYTESAGPGGCYMSLLCFGAPAQDRRLFFETFSLKWLFSCVFLRIICKEENFWFGLWVVFNTFGFYLCVYLRFQSHLRSCLRDYLRVCLQGFLHRSERGERVFCITLGIDFGIATWNKAFLRACKCIRSVLKVFWVCLSVYRGVDFSLPNKPYFL